MKSTIFIFGRTPALSLLELRSFYPEADSISGAIGMVHGDVSPHDMIHVLGGTVKIAEVVATRGSVSEDVLAGLLEQQAGGRRITFGISSYGAVRLPASTLPTLKEHLESRGVSARYIETKHGESLSSVVVSKQQITEIIVVEHDGEFFYGATRAVQDFEDWNKRDFGRPAADPKSGMLPPKVARMIVNIALAGTPPGHHPMLLDSFCGMGTILSEALLRGANVAGGDISQQAVDGAKKNLAWLKTSYPAISALYSNVVVSDATHMSEHITPESIDAIATEPFMGETVDVKDAAKLTPERVKNVLKGLEKLYIGALREWTRFLKPHARVVMAMPAYVVERNIYRVKNVVDRCESLGYTLLTEPIEYSRPQAVVRREFFVFQKK